ncbi:efflux RND transporter periplasmic adaptor subunit [Algihabitans albus]|uniref:efflux RND transporter periplasmic adaptor subunit n=1 Tax=Algihabitans albus TaxID=2164067 RepID=UPI0013C301C7|nr:efflux RND transporter periplasmic adaptor subunit [Algihabitans albus]
MVAGLVVLLGSAVVYGAYALAAKDPDRETDAARTAVKTEDAAQLDTLGPHAEIVRPAAVIEVTAQRPIQVRALPGTLHPARASRLAFRVGGPLIDLPVEEGDLAVAGSLLAEIDPRDFALAVAELEARLKAAQAARRLAVLQHRRQAQLVERGHTSRANLDEAIAERDRTAAETASLTQQLATAQAALDDTRLIAPFDGRVARLHVEQHDYLSARQTAITFHDVSGVDFVVDLPERMVARLRHLQGIEVELSDTPGESYRATIREMASEQAAETGTYRTTLRLSGVESVPPLAGLSGTAHLMFLDAAFRRSGEIALPSSAIFPGAEGGDRVWVVEGSPARVAARPVSVAAVEGDQVRIVAGLANGERIVAYGVDFLREGQAVRPLGTAGDPDGGSQGDVEGGHIAARGAARP